jgi:hypothetical protein
LTAIQADWLAAELPLPKPNPALVHVAATSSIIHPIVGVRSNNDLDLAVFDVPTLDPPSIKRGSAASLAIHDHLLVLGFPNYRLGESGVFNPGLVVGFRPHHGVRRVLTDAYIIEE